MYKNFLFAILHFYTQRRLLAAPWLQAQTPFTNKSPPFLLQPFSHPFFLNTNATTVPPTILRIAIVPIVVDAHLAVGALDVGQAAAKRRLHAYPRHVAGHAAAAGVGVIDAHLPARAALGRRPEAAAVVVAPRARRSRGGRRLRLLRRAARRPRRPGVDGGFWPVVRRGLGDGRPRRAGWPRARHRRGHHAPARAVLAARGGAGWVHGGTGAVGRAGGHLEAAGAVCTGGAGLGWLWEVGQCGNEEECCQEEFHLVLLGCLTGW